MKRISLTEAHEILYWAAAIMHDGDFYKPFVPFALEGEDYLIAFGGICIPVLGNLTVEARGSTFLLKNALGETVTIDVLQYWEAV